MIRAYEETYLNDAMNNLGDMFDYALCDLGYEPEAFFSEFLISGVAECFENGNPKYVAGLSRNWQSRSFPAQREFVRLLSLLRKSTRVQNTGQAGCSPIINGIRHAALLTCISGG